MAVKDNKSDNFFNFIYQPSLSGTLSFYLWTDCIF